MLAAVQEGHPAPLPGLHLVSEGQEGRQAQRPHHPRHHRAVQRGDGLRGQHHSEAPAAQAARPGAARPALDRHRSGTAQPRARQRTVLLNLRVTTGASTFLSVATGVSNTQELLVPSGHRVGAAVQPPLQAEEGVGLRAQVRFIQTHREQFHRSCLEVVGK